MILGSVMCLDLASKDIEHVELSYINTDSLMVTTTLENCLELSLKA